MGRLYQLIQDHMDSVGYKVSVRQVALKLGVSPTTVSNWRNIKELPKAEHLEAVSRLTGVPIKDVFYAAGVDAGYIVEKVVTAEELAEIEGGGEDDPVAN